MGLIIYSWLKHLNKSLFSLIGLIVISNLESQGFMYNFIIFSIVVTKSLNKEEKRFY
jgi:hypothetical protein